MENARDILALAESAREQGLTEAAKELYKSALEVALAVHDIVVASEVNAAKSILSRRLAKEAKTTEERHRMLEQATAEVKSAVLLARQAEFTHDRTALPLAFLAQAKLYALKENFPEAIRALGPAVTFTLEDLPEVHRRPSMIVYLQLELALFKLQNLENTETEILRCIALLIDDGGPDSHYNIPVWVSGAYLALATYFVETDLDKSKQYLKKAKEIIFFDDALKLRKRDYDRVEDLVLSSRM